MPFEEPQGKDVEMSLGYGEQVHPATGEKFFHHGIDFNVRCYMLSAVASGIVSGVGNDPVHGICQTVRYGGYEVTYGHLSNVFAHLTAGESRTNGGFERRTAAYRSQIQGRGTEPNRVPDHVVRQHQGFAGSRR